jgi:1,4-dihydroxy-2-naphthoate octaprenyltransferase
LLVTAILVVNNLRDIDTDRKAGKKTLAVRFGVKFTQFQYVLLVAGAYLVPLLMGLLAVTSYTVLLSWLSLPLVIPVIKDVYTKKGSPLNLTLAGTARLSFCQSSFRGRFHYTELVRDKPGTQVSFTSIQQQ